MTLSKKKKPAAASSVVSGEALGMDANIAMLVKERNANNAWHKLARNKTALVGFFIVAFMVVIAVFAPLIAPYDPNAINPVLSFKGIGTPGHLFGTDDLGRDILSRIIYGSRISMIVAVGATIVGAIIGVLIGLTAGYFGGWIDAVLMRIMDGMFSFPFILLAMILITVLGNGVMNVILAIGIASVPGFARVTRGQVLIVKEEEYCNACRVVGVSPGKTPVLTYFAELCIPDHRLRDTPYRKRHHLRGVLKLLRTRHRASDRLLGQHSPCRP